MDKLTEMIKELEAFLEESLAKPLGGKVPAADLADQLVREVSNTTRRDDSGKAYAPDQYTLSMHPQNVDELLLAAPRVQSDLSKGFERILSDGGYTLIREPHITLATDPTLPDSEVRLIAWHSSNVLSLSPDSKPVQAESEDQLPSGAFLIVEGKRHFPLDKPIVSIGRRLDNQLVLSDSHVSRKHAQLRVRNGRYVIYDLESTAGTQVNGRPIHQHILRPGDVISIAGVPLIYGEDSGGPPDVTPPYSPPFGTPEDINQITPLDLRKFIGKETRPHDHATEQFSFPEKEPPDSNKDD
ncbi:MAG TPA: FhaA domain-containing protein [Anaerolineales bacterium]|nr:FhaA domain-containing protein [Anaerolineales bacterium]